jgi:pimeloyl-ACP methyl ester carboxylesterase
MSASHGSLARAACVLGLALGLTSGQTRAGEPWQVLPPTPELPQGTTSRFAAIHGARIWYAEWGPKAQGVPVLLLHGGFANANYFGHLIPVLVERGYHVIAMDSRGHGRSTRTNVPQTYHQMAEDVVGLLDALKVQRVSIVGWSDGGNTGIDLAINHPGRVARLFTFGANSEMSGLIDGGDKTPVFGAYMRRVRDEYRALSPTPSQWAGFEAAMNEMWGSLPAYTTEQLRSIKVPTTIADGEHDEVIKADHTKYLAATIPGARLVILPNVSHFAMLQNPAEFNAAVVDFLQPSRSAAATRPSVRQSAWSSGD